MQNELGSPRHRGRDLHRGRPHPVAAQFSTARRCGRDADGTPRPARPTSRSTIQEWATLLDGARNILVVVNQPHLSRVRLDVLDELARAGHGGLSLDVAGARALRDSVDLNLLLGEIPARVNAERRIGQA